MLQYRFIVSMTVCGINNLQFENKTSYPQWIKIISIFIKKSQSSFTIRNYLLMFFNVKVFFSLWSKPLLICLRIECLKLFINCTVDSLTLKKHNTDEFFFFYWTSWTSNKAEVIPVILLKLLQGITSWNKKSGRLLSDLFYSYIN